MYTYETTNKSNDSVCLELFTENTLVVYIVITSFTIKTTGQTCRHTDLLRHTKDKRNFKTSGCIAGTHSNTNSVIYTTPHVKLYYIWLA